MPKRCPYCNTEWEDKDRFCGNCGAVLETARGVHREPQREIPAALQWVLDLFPGFFKPGVLVGSVLAIAFSLGAFWLTLLLLQFHVFITVFIVGGCGVMIYWTGVSWILYGYVCSPAEAMAEFQSRHWLVLILATAIPVSVLMLLAKGAGG